MSAEWLVGAVCGATSAEGLRAALSKADAGAFAEASRASCVDGESALVGAKLPLGRDGVAHAAAVRAAGEGRAVASVVDVVWVAVAAVAAGTKKSASKAPAGKVGKPKAPTEHTAPAKPMRAPAARKPVVSKATKAGKASPVRKPATSKAKRGIASSGVDARVVRVFVSSTFRDMQEERDELVKHTFPQLRKLCESRGVTWGEVDLRWGITDEARAEGKVLPTCLAEIRGCRPFFIGMLGERYGWVPDEIEPAALEDEPWVADHVGRSVTELEILHGVLNDPSMAEHAFFYLRDPAYVDGKPAGQFREAPTSDEATKYGQAEADRRADDRSAMLVALKERLRTSGLPVREDYPNPRTLGELVLADLTEVVDRLYPEGSEPDPLTREQAEHEAFARSRAGVYIGRKAYVDRLDAHVKGNGQPLVVIGESGSGKSALLANWALDYRAAHPDVFVLPHFVGASPTSTDWAGMVRRIIAELSYRFELKVEIPHEASALRITFATALHMAAVEGPVVLVIDAVNQLEDREGALDLSWILPVVPDGIRLVVSTLPGRPLDEATKRGWATLTVEPLQPTEREALITEYLASHSRALSPTLATRIAAAPPTANPLYLRAILDELRVWGDHDTLPDRIDHYLKAKSVDALYERILKRYEDDYERDRPGLVRDAFTFLWASRRGLSETELLDLLGDDDNPLPRACWSPLFLACESALTNRSGLLTFFHDYLRHAVERRYALMFLDDGTVAHLKLARYFVARDDPRRAIEESMWQLANAEEWKLLADLLAVPEYLEVAWRLDPFGVRRAWAQIERNSPIRLVDGYRAVIEAADPDDEDEERAFSVAQLLGATGHATEALAIQTRLASAFGAAGIEANAVAAMGSRANILADHGEFEEAMALLDEAERMCRKSRDDARLQAILGGQANVLRARGETERAMACYSEVEGISRRLGDHATLRAVLNNQAALLLSRDDLDGASARLEEAERLCREHDDPEGLAEVLGNQADVFARRGDLAHAMDLFEAQARICRDIMYLAGLQRSLGNQGTLRVTVGDYEGAMTQLKEQERICRELGNPEWLVNALMRQVDLHFKSGHLSEHAAVVDEALELAEKHRLVHLAQGLRQISDTVRASAHPGAPTSLTLPGSGKSLPIAKDADEFRRWVREGRECAGVLPLRDYGSAVKGLDGRSSFDFVLVCRDCSLRLDRSASFMSGLTGMKKAVPNTRTAETVDYCREGKAGRCFGCGGESAVVLFCSDQL
jgi:tetratricopeptide (TPR) repeat protein